MQLTGNTVLVTGGDTGIGRDLAESFHWLGNRVVVAGRHHAPLRAVAGANPGMRYLRLDQRDPAEIRRFAVEITTRYPDLNVVINNAGISRVQGATAGNAEQPRAIEAVGLLGPIRLTTALLPTVLTQPRAAIVNVTSGLAFVPEVAAPRYCVTKAALHSYTQLLRFRLRDTRVGVFDITYRAGKPGSSPAHRIVRVAVAGADLWMITCCQNVPSVISGDTQSLPQRSVRP